MREVAKGWDEDKRRAMYTELLNATFLVPLDPEVGDEVDGGDAFLNFETHASGRPTLGAFSDWASLRLWEPRGWPYVPMHGSEVFELAHERQPVSFRINPNGDVGGELYGHEVEMLVQVVRDFRARRSN
nr:SseB family protein [Pseudenhygromyxa sp. WMMC2535]